MDLSLWDAPRVQVDDDSQLYLRKDWYSDFHFGYCPDIIEEEALNEKSCAQVLRILIAKADAEIKQLEEATIEREAIQALANTEWSTLCFGVLREKIDCIEKAIRSLKDEQGEHDPDEVQIITPREPAESLHVILKELLCKNLEQKTTQNDGVIIGDSIENKLVEASTKELEKTDPKDDGVIIRDQVENKLVDTSAKEPEKTDPKDNRLQKGDIQNCTLDKEGSIINLSRADEVPCAILTPISDASTSVIKDSCEGQDHKLGLETAGCNKEDTKSRLAQTQHADLEMEAHTEMDGQEQDSAEVEPYLQGSLPEVLEERKSDGAMPLGKLGQESQVSKIMKPEGRSTDSSLKNKSVRKRHVNPEPAEERCLMEELGLDAESAKKLKCQKKSGSTERVDSEERDKKSIDKEDKIDSVGLSDGASSSAAISTPCTPDLSKVGTILPAIKENEDASNLQLLSATQMTTPLMESVGRSITKAASAVKNSGPGALRVSDLECMTKEQLTAVARKHKLKRYSKYSKAGLIDFIAKELKLQVKKRDG